MDFSLSSELVNLKEHTRKFVNEIVIPAESRVPKDVANWHDLRDELQDAAREAASIHSNSRAPVMRIADQPTPLPYNSQYLGVGR